MDLRWYFGDAAVYCIWHKKMEEMILRLGKAGSAFSSTRPGAKGPRARD
jgi:hypothetical protein